MFLQKRGFMAYQRYQFDFREKDAQSAERPDLNLLYISHARSDRHWQSILHAHPFMELFYIVNGTGLFRTETDTFLVQQDDLVIINPNVMHTEVNQEKETLEYIVLGLDGFFFGSADNALVPYSIHSMKNHRTELLFYMKSIIQEAHDKQQSYIEVCQNLLEILIYLVARLTKSNPNFATIDKVSRECRFMEQYMDEHFADDITLDTLSELTHMNKYYIVHAFKKYKGVSPISYLINRRISEAKSLLESSDFPISKIAQQVGFSSQSYFSQVFRKEVDISPGAYRKQHAKKTL